MSDYAFANNPSNPDAKPLYNDNVLKFWNWLNTVWDCNDWITWHKTLVTKYGKEVANNKWLHEWNNLATGSSAIDCRSLNSAFRDYVSKVGLMDSVYSGLGIIAKPIGAVTDLVTGVTGGVRGVSKALKVAIPIIIFVVVIIVLMTAYKKVKSK